jgi:hypothetical protein
LTKWFEGGGCLLVFVFVENSDLIFKSGKKGGEELAMVVNDWKWLTFLEVLELNQELTNGLIFFPRGVHSPISILKKTLEGSEGRIQAAIVDGIRFRGRHRRHV